MSYPYIELKNINDGSIEFLSKFLPPGAHILDDDNVDHTRVYVKLYNEVPVDWPHIFPFKYGKTYFIPPDSDMDLPSYFGFDPIMFLEDPYAEDMGVLSTEPTPVSLFLSKQLCLFIYSFSMLTKCCSTYRMKFHGKLFLDSLMISHW